MTIEQWRDVRGFEGLYKVSDRGRIKSVQRTVPVAGHWQKAKTLKERILAQKVNRPTGGSYVRSVVTLCKEGRQTTRNAARIVAEAFLSNPLNLPCVLHKDDDALNNSADNLEWGTHQENMRQAAERDRIRYGQEHSAARMTDIERRRAYLMLSGGAPVSRIAAAFGVSHQTICDLKHGKLKGYDRLEAPRLFTRGSCSPRAKLNESQVLEIKRMLARGDKHAEIGERFSVAKSTIAAINRGANWAWLQPTAQAS
jgi:transposase